jgi:ribosome biogenesis protein Tsr3
MTDTRDQVVCPYTNDRVIFQELYSVEVDCSWQRQIVWIVHGNRMTPVVVCPSLIAACPKFFPYGIVVIEFFVE